MKEEFPRQLTEDYYDDGRGPSLTYHGYNLYKTCIACPEQYDVFKDGKLVGYIRLRGGWLQAFCPDVFLERVYFHEFPNDEWKGCFETDEEQDYYLEYVIIAIDDWVRKNELESQSLS